MAQRKRHFVGKGKFALRKRGLLIPMRRVGNCSKTELTFNETTSEFPDYENNAGGSAASYVRLDTVEIALDLRIFSPDNLAFAYHGNVKEVAAALAIQKSLVGGIGVIPLNDMAGGTVTLEDAEPAAWVAETAYAVGDRVKSGVAPNVRSHRCVVAGTSGENAPAWSTNGGTTADDDVTWQDEGPLKTYAKDTDFIVHGGAIEILEASEMPVGKLLTATYDRSKHYLTELLVNSPQDWEIHIAGLNEADSGVPHSIDLPLVKFGASQSLPLIGDEFAALSLNGRVNKYDAALPGESAFCRIRQLAA